MTCFSLANVALGYHLSRNESRFAWVVAASIVVQVAVLATVPDTLRGVLWADAASGIGLLVAHEFTVGSSAGRSARASRCWRRRWSCYGGSALALRSVDGCDRSRACLCGYALLAVVVTWPLALHLGSALPGTFPNDGTGGARGSGNSTARVASALRDDPSRADRCSVRMGSGQRPQLPVAVAVLPRLSLIGVVGEVAAINLVTLAGSCSPAPPCISSCAGWAVRRWSPPGPGAVYLAFPWHLERAMAGHSSLVHLEMFPLFVLAGARLGAEANRPSCELRRVGCDSFVADLGLFRGDGTARDDRSDRGCVLHTPRRRGGGHGTKARFEALGDGGGRYGSRGRCLCVRRRCRWCQRRARRS